MDNDNDKWTSLMKLAKDFEDRASVYAQVIVMELAISDNFDRQIMSVDIGGTAGGDKYIVRIVAWCGTRCDCILMFARSTICCSN